MLCPAQMLGVMRTIQQSDVVAFAYGSHSQSTLAGRSVLRPYKIISCRLFCLGGESTSLLTAWQGKRT
jgi:hypothetical protein